ncbi:hypothetical protein [Maribacter forsetii]|uniref:hypothetical protein n=1 Tax=Maribacter forsetii TaxID=444515 RepID=UPI00055BA029|nr:hypothetical protein [Maribacter forsetii]
MNITFIIILIAICSYLILDNIKIRKILNEYNSEFSERQKSLKLIEIKISKNRKEFANIERELFNIRIQKEKEKLMLSKLPTEEYTNLTINQFRKITNNLIQKVENSIEKESIINFLKFDLSYIDLSKVTFENLELNREVEIEKQVAIITNSGKIQWRNSADNLNVNLIIGKPLKRIEYYNKVIELIMKNIVD